MKKMKAVLLLSLSCFASVSYALPFDITPVGTLPTGVIQGNPVSAAYTVTNNTSRQLNNIIVHVPQHVGVTNSGCGPKFNLAAGASCTLTLNITDAVSATDPDPSNHLYVCLPGGKTCAGTKYPLNVSTLAPPAFAFIGNDSSINGLYMCAVSGDTGNFEKCNLIPGPDAAGNNVFRNPQWLAFTVSGLRAYISDAGYTPDVIWLCDLNTTTGLFSNCHLSGASGITTPTAITLNAAGTRVYITDSTANRVYMCNVNLPTGDLSGCADSGAGATFLEPKGIAINPAGTLAYIANANTGGAGTVVGCNINASTGLLSGCATQASITEPYGIVFIPSGTQAYVTSKSTDNVYLCNVTASSGALTCVITGTTTDTGGAHTFSDPIGIALSVSRSQPAQVYVASSTSGVMSVCNYCGTDCTAGQDPGELTCSNSTSGSGLATIIGVTLGKGLTTITS